MPMSKFILLSVILCSFFILSHSLKLLRRDGLALDVLVWRCEDDVIKAAVTQAFEAYNTADEINAAVQDEVTKIKSGYWIVYTQQYLRATADLLPPSANPKTLCFVQVETTNMITVVAQIATSI